MAEVITTAVPIIVGLIFVALAVLERGYKQYLEAKKTDATLKFGGAYMLNLLVSTGVTSVIIITIIPALLSGLTSVPTELTLSAVILQAILGYTVAWTTLDKLNTGTEKKEEIAALKKGPS